MLRIAELGPKLQEADVIDLETNFGTRLPNAYRTFLLHFNGGVPTPDTIDIPDLPGSPTDVQIFFGIRQSIESSDLTWNLELFSGRYPGQVIVSIARDSGDDYFCLRISEDGSHQVVFTEWWDQTGKFYDVAPNFDDLLLRLREFE